MDLSEKIKQILVQKNISPSLFADEIGIQRSSISHILAGRNKPSLDIVQKIVKRFPELGIEWILGDGEIPVQSSDVNGFKSINKTLISIPKSNQSTSLEFNRKNSSLNPPTQENVRPDPKVSQKEKTIERILIFYSDGTFQEFKQPY